MLLRVPRLTLAGKSYALVAGLLIANLGIWAAALALFAPDAAKRRVLALCAIAWTLGLRHALDADHISAIDNATRQMVALGRRPLTCGLFFSLGHSTIVIAVTVAIAISVGVADRLDGVAAIGGVVGASVSASFLFLLGVINSVFLHKALQEQKRQKNDPTEGTAVPPAFGCMGRIARPLLRLIDRPWKMYPIGILFGFGFDTASEIGLLGVSALAQTGTGDEALPSSNIVILPLLFTAGMSLVDSLDAILMLWGYVWPNIENEHWKVVFEKKNPPAESPSIEPDPLAEDTDDAKSQEITKAGDMKPRPRPVMYNNLSIALTVISIVVAFAISIIEFMGIALDNCDACSDAADNDPGLPGNWWRFWATVNDNSGYVGAGIVGVMILCCLIYYCINKWRLRAKRKKENKEEPATEGVQAGNFEV